MPACRHVTAVIDNLPADHRAAALAVIASGQEHVVTLLPEQGAVRGSVQVYICCIPDTAMLSWARLGPASAKCALSPHAITPWPRVKYTLATLSAVDKPALSARSCYQVQHAAVQERGRRASASSPKSCPKCSHSMMALAALWGIS